MKRITLFLLGLFLTSYINAQIDKAQYQLLSDDNKKLYNELILNEYNRVQRVDSFLLNNKNVKQRYISGSGIIYEIKDVINGFPIYRTTDNSAAAIATKTNQLNTGGSMGLNLDGDGFTVGVWDGGPVQNSHPEFAISTVLSRVTVIDTETPDGDVGFSNHGTHVAGTIGASGVDAQAKGMAPNVLIKSYGWNNDYVEMFVAHTDASNPIFLSNHSYGVPVDSYVNSGNEWVMGAYVQDSRTVDQIIYNNPGYLPVFSAGNSGTVSYTGQSYNGYDKLTGDKTAKNNLVVANANPFAASNGNLFSLNINPGSSQGPTDDLRIKPDLAGDGTNVYSTTTNNTYSTFSGTSMSAPNLTGTLVLLQEYYSDLNSGELMNASTLKGLVCHTAVDDSANIGPDPIFGWGLLDARASAELINSANMDEAIITESTLNNNDVYSINFTVSAGQKLSATLCWTDVPGTVSNGTLNDPTPVLVNDLDIRLTNNGTTYLPWKLTPSIIGGITNVKADNTVDNLERIDIENPTPGDYTLTISHKNSLQGVGSKQDFSLIVSGNNLILNIDDNELGENLMLFPNPSKGDFTVSFDSRLLNNSNDDVEISVYDLSGRMIYNDQFENNNATFTENISLSDVRSGIYLVKIVSGGRSTSRKLIID